jgi:serine phosphatase RsbU (regulator of sigma subunit)
MRKRLITAFVILLAVPGVFFGQNAVVDSLQNLLNKAEGKAKINLCFEISQEMYKVDALKAVDFANQAVIYAKNTGDNNIIGEAYKNLGSVNDNDQKAAEAFEKALSFFEKAANKTETGDILNNLAITKNYQNEIDQSITYSLRAVDISKEIKDASMEAAAYYNLGNSYYNQNNFEKALDFHKKSLEIRQKLGNNTLIASSLLRLGTLSYSKQDFKHAEDYYNQVLVIRRQENDRIGAGKVLNNLGNTNNQLGNYDKAIANYKEAYDIFKSLDFKPGIASTLNGMGVIYGYWNYFPNALKVYMETLEIVKDLGDQKEMANTMTNIGIVYNSMINDTLQKIYGAEFVDSVFIKKLKLKFEIISNAIRYHSQSLELRKQMNDIRGIGTCVANLGMTYTQIGDSKKARQYFEQWLSISDQIQDKDQETAIYISLSQLYRYDGDYEKEIDYLNRANATAKEIDMKSHLQTISLKLSQVHALKGDYKLALDYYKNYSNLKDTLLTQDGQKLISEMQVKYETDAKEKENQLLRKDQVINESRLKQQRFAIYTFLFVILAVIGFVIMLIRQNNQKKKANFELAKKNALITEQKKEITDSIQYASRIQKAILPPKEYIEQLLPNHFIIYRPRDIVSGDYYWITEKGSRIYIMIADCTGHGVPGAFMSMLGVAFLNEIVSKHTEISANQLLNELRKQVIISLHQTGREGENQDGMDVALYIIDNAEMKLEYSGANNSLLIYRGEEFIELKADKMPIGIHRMADNSFTNYNFDLKKGDMIYGFSDGYPDQFGGPNGKKFMIKNLKAILQTINLLPMPEQKTILEKHMDDWMIGTHQIDDILVMGVRI